LWAFAFVHHLETEFARLSTSAQVFNTPPWKSSTELVEVESR